MSGGDKQCRRQPLQVAVAAKGHTDSGIPRTFSGEIGTVEGFHDFGVESISFAEAVPRVRAVGICFSDGIEQNQGVKQSLAFRREGCGDGEVSARAVAPDSDVVRVDSE